MNHPSDDSLLLREPLLCDPVDTPRVLIVDDDEFIADSLCRWLAANGCACDVARDIPAAVAFAETRDYAVVLIDPYLTGGTSGGVVTRLRGLQPQARVIVVTAYATAEFRAAGERSEFHLIEKPQSVVSLGHLVMRTVREAHP